MAKSRAKAAAKPEPVAEPPGTPHFPEPEAVAPAPVRAPLPPAFVPTPPAPDPETTMVRIRITDAAEVNQGITKLMLNGKIMMFRVGAETTVSQSLIAVMRETSLRFDILGDVQ